MSLMSTYGTLERKGKENNRQYRKENGDWATVSFQYPEVVYNHYQYRDAVDAHNSSRMDPIALEETWKTVRWPLRVFQFLLAVTEVNVRLAKQNLFGEEERSQQNFRKHFAYALINNRFLLQDKTRKERKTKRKTSDNHHKLVALPPYKIFRGARLIKSNTRSLQRKCSCGMRRVNTYCRCTPGVLFCTSCFVKHVSDAETGAQIDD